jgi:hypothetical protein
MGLTLDMANGMLATGVVLGVCFAVLAFADRIARTLKRM